MFARLSNSWALFKASWNVLLADKELLIFPIVSMIGAILVTATFITPIILGNLAENFAGENGKIIAGIVAFVFYVVLYSVIFFCNTALVGAAMIRLDGGDPTLKDGFRIASQHLGSIFGYALLSATVGMILRWMRDKGVLGRIASGLFGLAWNLATYFVVPVLVTEKVGPIEAVKRSGALLKKTGGEQIAGNLGVGAVTGLMIFGLVATGVVAAILAGSIAPVAAIVVGGIFVLAIVAVGLVSSALTGIYTAAVYRYATTGNAGAYFDAGLVQGAFRVR